jgi:DNA-binding SARP family transcriptional activator
MSRPSIDAVPSSGLRVRVLGPLEVTADGVPLVVDTRKALAILALLATEGRRFARDELAALLWPESGDDAARGALRRTLSVLRSSLGDRWLAVDRAGVGLADAWVDLEVLARVGGDGEAGLPALRAATDLVRGPFLAGFSLRDSPEFDDWRATRATAVDRTVGALLDRLATAAEAAGDLVAARAAAARRIDLDPLDEPAHRRLMRLLARTGDRTGAIRQYRACVAVLERELGVTPLAETTAVYEAIRDSAAGPPSASDTPVAPVQASGAARSRLPFVGREAELGAVIEAYRSCETDGRVVAIVGEAGIGKSRLAEAVSDAVRAAGGGVLAARAFASESGIAYGPIVELLRSGLTRPDGEHLLAPVAPALLAELERLIGLPAPLADRIGRYGRRERPGVADVPAARARLLDAVAEGLAALAAGPAPGLLVVDDVHWADDATRETLLWLARRLAGRSLLLVLTWRPEDLDDTGAAFARMVEDLPGVVRVPLGPLNRSAVEQLISAAAVTGAPRLRVDELLEESEGLPLYLVEALASGASTVEGPGRSVRTLLAERLSAVGEPAGQVLAAAAVLGRTFDLASVRAISGRSEDETVAALEELLRRGLVREVATGRPDGFDFAHARLRDAAYDATTLVRRRLLHRRAAELLRSDPSGRDDPGRLVQLATHERAAGRVPEAAEAFRQAGLRARELYAHREAAAHLDAALALGHEDVAGIQLTLGEIRMAQGDYGPAAASFEAAAAVTSGAGLAGVEVRLGRLHARRGDLVAAGSHLDAAVELLGAARSPDASMVTRALVERAAVAYRAGDLHEAATAASRALETAGAAGDDAGAGAAHRLLGLVARGRGDLVGARSELRRSLELASSALEVDATVAAQNALALVEAAAGDRKAAIDLLEAALETCRRTGERHLEAAVENNLADQLYAAGRPDEAMEHLKRAVAIFAEVGSRPGELEPEIWKLVAW